MKSVIEGLGFAVERVCLVLCCKLEGMTWQGVVLGADRSPPGLIMGAIALRCPNVPTRLGPQAS